MSAIFTARNAVNMYIHEHPDWPRFEFDLELLATPLAEFRFVQGRFLGSLQAMGIDASEQAALDVFSEDAVETSAIEGEKLDRSLVRSSVACLLDLSVSDNRKIPDEVLGLTSVLVSATENAQGEITLPLILSWHRKIITGANYRPGKLRVAAEDPMQVVSPVRGIERVHFEAPSGAIIESELEKLIEFLNLESNLDPVLKSGIGHLWLITLHPFLDGNGRISRLLGDVLLSRADGLSRRYYSLTAEISAQREDYYRILQQVQSGDMNITAWLSWYLSVLSRAVTSAEQRIIKLRNRKLLLDRCSTANARQRTVVERMLSDDFEGFMQVSKYAKIVGCSSDTALRDIRGLIELGVLTANESGGRSTSYRLVDLEPN